MIEGKSGENWTVTRAEMAGLYLPGVAAAGDSRYYQNHHPSQME